MGFVDPVTAVVVLSGAHNIGQSRVTAQGQCSKGISPLTASPNSLTATTTPRWSSRPASVGESQVQEGRG